jgi:hypothetical protein
LAPIKPQPPVTIMFFIFLFSPKMSVLNSKRHSTIYYF